ncbi:MULTISPECIES: ParA family protein [Aeromonas]|jgi:cellulose biosynthesis protein BcsQ|uniref:AAA family ATPase n=1 Tax=Aeromonas media TaxID=651 RepID=A0AAE6SN02_AERME|nr:MULTISPECIES: ParA family protein [Aeromonas]MBA8782064.1 AAA family ATPase [Aeromonas caviae]MBA8786119.1 AAA family ATPase [Aeromonas sp. TW 6]QHQ53645.1 AAA family ATPase [Aeromonas media]QQQ16077.1 AAA family ATPase [Aeromonas media]RDD50643.1 ParA family protein [Aeromonas sp. ARM81]
MMDVDLAKQQQLMRFESLRDEARFTLDYLENAKNERIGDNGEDEPEGVVFSQYQLHRLPNMTRAKADAAIKLLEDSGREFNQKPSKNNARTLHSYSHADVRAIYKASGQRSYAEMNKVLGASQSARVVGCINLKGGVGKTTSLVTIATGLVHHRNLIKHQLRVAVIDLDPQGSTSLAFGFSGLGKKDQHSAIEAIASRATPDTVRSWMLPTSSDGLFVMPAGRADGLFSLQAHQHAAETGVNMSELLTKFVIDPLRDSFDCILCDVGPHLDGALINTLEACDSLFVPISLDPLELDSSLKFLESIHGLLASIPTARLNPDSVWIMASKYDGTNPQHLDHFKLLRYLDHVRVLTNPLELLRPFSVVSEDGRTVFTIHRNDYSGAPSSLSRAQYNAEMVIQEFFANVLEVAK